MHVKTDFMIDTKIKNDGRFSSCAAVSLRIWAIIPSAFFTSLFTVTAYTEMWGEIAYKNWDRH